MRIVKLDNRHRLYKEGFTHAFRFSGWTDKCRAVESTLSNKYGVSWNNTKCWGSYWGKPSRSGSRIIWIGVRNEALLSQVLLSLK